MIMEKTNFHHITISLQPKTNIMIMSTILYMSTIFFISTFLYCHNVNNNNNNNKNNNTLLNGPWILDDKGTISMNPIVTQSIPLQNVWMKDFWGIHNVNDTLSHKSWRPL